MAPQLSASSGTWTRSTGTAWVARQSRTVNWRHSSPEIWRTSAAWPCRRGSGRACDRHMFEIWLWPERWSKRWAIGSARTKNKIVNGILIRRGALAAEPCSARVAYIQPRGQADLLRERDSETECSLPASVILWSSHIAVLENEQRHRDLIAVLPMIGIQFEGEFGAAQILHRYILFGSRFIGIQLAAVRLIVSREHVNDEETTDQLPILFVIRILRKRWKRVGLYELEQWHRPGLSPQRTAFNDAELRIIIGTAFIRCILFSV